MEFQDTRFHNQEVRLDHGRFERCEFADVILEYGGGPVHIADCRFTGRLQWRFTGDLGRGLAAIGQLYAGRQAAGLKAIVDAMFPAKGADRPAPDQN